MERVITLIGVLTTLAVALTHLVMVIKSGATKVRPGQQPPGPAGPPQTPPA